MDRHVQMDKQRFVAQMQAEVRRILEQVADAVNDAPTGNLIGGSEIPVRDLMAQLRQAVFQTAVPRLDDTAIADTTFTMAATLAYPDVPFARLVGYRRRCP